MIARAGEAAKLTGFHPHVRFGSEADMAQSNSDVCFTSESRHSTAVAECLVWARKRHMHRSKSALFDHFVGASEQ
jgi:hypothetical protein